MKNVRILGVSASLRNARRGLGNQDLLNDIGNLQTEAALHDYLKQEAAVHLQHFKDAGRDEQKPFDEMYKALRKLKGNRGLSNSEVALAAAMWSAKELGCELDHLSLSEHFTETTKVRDLDKLRAKLLAADGILISTPVYFGDRGSLAQSLVELIRNDDELREQLAGKVYGGLAVGAKRNGGQETTLIYQLWDMVQTGFLGVGNDSETTSQYGGTGLAGDIGTMPDDEYGLKTAMGTGRRIARVTQMLQLSNDVALSGKHRATFLILQDKDQVAANTVQALVDSQSDQLDATILHIEDKTIIRCLACDICPTHIDTDDVYRCIIHANRDDLEDLHPALIESDAIIPVAYSPDNRDGLISNYQRFIERTRYIRRADYIMSDIVTAPIVISDVHVSENLPLRMMTSLMRHHTVVSKPIELLRYKEDLLDWAYARSQFAALNKVIRRVTAGRLQAYSEGVNHLKYNPVGYVLSAVKDLEDERMDRRHRMIERRVETAREQSEERLAHSEPT